MTHFPPSVFGDWQAARSIFRQKGLGRPFVTLAFAQSLDGCLAKQAGHRTQLSDQESWAVTHHLRSLHDGILIGRRTLLTDDPQLNVRFFDGPSPRPIILDTHAESPVNARVFHLHPQGAILATARRDPEALALRYPGTCCLTIGAKDGLIDLHQLLTALYQQGIHSLMVEGGGQVLSSFFRESLCDFAVINITPTIIGGDDSVRYKVKLSQTLDLDSQGFVQSGRDFWIWGHVQDRKESLSSHSLFPRKEAWQSASRS